MKGKFIVIEGVDGAGKTTVITHLQSKFSGGSVFFTREPGGTKIGKFIRDILVGETMDPMSEILLFFADRREHLLNVVGPALESGIHVICDRFEASTYAYQLAGHEHMEYEELFKDLSARVVGPMAPDHYILIDVPTEVAAERMRLRPGEQSKFDAKDEAFHRRTREAYKKFLAGYPHTVIDGSRKTEDACGHVEQVVREILAK
ncbi:MAG: dTMP kinase [bacterium]|nr:dTMP kinase [bacterium]